MTKSIYLSSPSKFRTYSIIVKNELEKLGYDVFDPLENELTFPVERDIEEIKKRDMLIAILPSLSIGGCMEIWIAHEFGKKVIVFSPMNSSHPWLKYCATNIFTKIDDLISYMKKLKEEEKK